MKVKERKKILKLRQRNLPKLSLELGYLIRPVIIILTSVIISGIYYFGLEVSQLSLKEGDIALRDIYAPFSFKYRLGIDEEKTQEAKANARRSAGEVYALNGNASQELLNIIFNILNSLPQEESQPSIPQDLLPYIPQDLRLGDLYKLGKQYSGQEIISMIQPVITEYYKNRYILSLQDYKRLSEVNPRYIYIKSDGNSIQISLDSARLVDVSKAREEISRELNRVLKFRGGDVVVKIAVWNLKPNLIYDKVQTEQLKKSAEENVPNVYIYKEVKKNEKILSRGEKVSKEDLMKLKEINKITGANKLPTTMGIFLFSLLFLSLITVSYKFYNPKFYQDISKLLLVSLIIIIIVTITKFIIISPFPSYLIPVAMAGMVISMLISFPVAIKVAIFLSILVGIMIGDNILPAICFLAGSITGSLAVRDVRKRSQLLKAGLLVGEIQFLTVLSLGLFFNLSYTYFIREGLIALSNGLLSSFLVLGVLPVLEHSFKITTNIRLLELSDLNHPLLKELLLKAPGTYHHSLIVSNLAERAAEAVGANPLLTRVGGYFHDIGKLEKPEYFSENQVQGKDKTRHEKLTPSMSSLIIINHVKKGIELAQKYKLPPAIIDFIEQHHGTSLVYYFYHKALENKGEEEIKEEQFRYPGPKPQTKEVAIVSLADAVEAATRSLQEPTPARIKGLVKEIINNKFVEGELDECELTLKDLNRISEVFIRMILSIHHVRVEYPSDKKQV